VKQLRFNLSSVFFFVFVFDSMDIGSFYVLMFGLASTSHGRAFFTSNVIYEVCKGVWIFFIKSLLWFRLDSTRSRKS
jgi:hypothetical protein